MAIKQATVKPRRVWTAAMLKEKKQNQKAKARRNRAAEAPNPRYKPGERPKRKP